MVQILLRRWRRIQFHREYSRCQLRALLKKASQGDPQAYLKLVTPYVDLVHEYLYLTGCQGSARRREAVLNLFTGLWTRLRYTGRLSDFERLLTRTLIASESSELAYHSALEGAMSQLSGKDRFLIVAREMEDWHLRWVGLASRRGRRRLEQCILAARAHLIGFDLKSLAASQRRLLALVSRSLDEVWPESRRKELGRLLATQPEILQFKAAWLETRCKLIELRQDLRLDSEARREFDAALLTRIADSVTLQPSVGQRVLNVVKFDAVPDLRISG